MSSVAVSTSSHASPLGGLGYPPLDNLPVEQLVLKPLTQLPQLIAIDFDGTMAESEVSFQVRAGLPILHEFGYSNISPESFEWYVRNCNPLGMLSPKERARCEEPFWDRLNCCIRPEPKLLPETVEALRMMQGLGCQIALSTARPVPYSCTQFENQLRELGILSFLSVVEGRRLPSCYVRGSDKTDQLRAISEATQISPSKMAVIGDTPPDIIAGRMKKVLYVVAVRTGGINDEALLQHGPDALLDSILDFALMLQALRQPTS